MVSTEAGCPAASGKDKQKARVEAKCPVSGEKISKTASVDYKGGKLYFCCAGCIAKFDKDKAKYEVKANQQLVAELREFLRGYRRLRMVKVEGHAGVPENERCDLLARQAIARHRGL